MAIKFELTEEQEEKLKEWQEKIKDLHGEYGLYEFTFCSNGIGNNVKVFSKLANITLDLTDIDNW